MADKKIELGGISFEGVEVDGREVILVSSKGDMTLTAAKKGTLAFTLGTDSNKATYIFEDHAVYNSDKTAVSLIGSADDYSATNSSRSTVVTINASQVDTAIKITGNDNANVIIAGDEDSTLNGGEGNDTLIGGEGEDIFVYKNNQGNDLIRGYDEDHGDKISLVGGATVTDAVVDKNYSVVFTVGKNKLTVEDASYQAVTFIDNKGTEKIFKDGVFYASDGKSVTVPASFSEKGETSFDNSVVTIDASAAKKGVELAGNSLDNSIVGSAKNDTISGYGGADTIEGGKGNDELYGGAGDDSLVGGDGNDSLEGGAGNDELYGDKGNDKLWGGKGDDVLTGGKGSDSLWGDAGNDTFIYTPGDGKDVIFGFDNGDTLTIDDFDVDNMKATVNKKGTEVKIKIGAGSVTFKDFDADTFHINDATYQLTEVTNSKGKVTGYKFEEA